MNTKNSDLEELEDRLEAVEDLEELEDRLEAVEDLENQRKGAWKVLKIIGAIISSIFLAAIGTLFSTWFER